MGVFCVEVLLAPWVFKPRETKHSAVVTKILFATRLSSVSGLGLYYTLVAAY